MNGFDPRIIEGGRLIAFPPKTEPRTTREWGVLTASEFAALDRTLAVLRKDPEFAHDMIKAMEEVANEDGGA
jgi:hypothetical protein